METEVAFEKQMYPYPSRHPACFLLKLIFLCLNTFVCTKTHNIFLKTNTNYTIEEAQDFNKTKFKDNFKEASHIFK